MVETTWVKKMSIHAKIAQGYVNAVKLLKHSGLFHTENTTRPFTFAPTKYSEEWFKASLSDDYNYIYKTAREHANYDILLTDQSVLQFSYEEDKDNNIHVIRYAYYESPNKIPTYTEFLGSHGLSYEECGEDFYQDYEQVISEAALKSSVTPIRYDYDLPLYKKVAHHPASHLHIGHNNELRIPLFYILTPIGFIAIVLRQIYRKEWLTALTNEKFSYLYRSIKTCDHVPDAHFKVAEREDFYIV